MILGKYDKVMVHISALEACNKPLKRCENGYFNEQLSVTFSVFFSVKVSASVCKK